MPQKQGLKQPKPSTRERACLAHALRLMINCPTCRTVTVVKPGENVQCGHCGFTPKFLWNGISYMLTAGH
jgi:hypothetical protein